MLINLLFGAVVRKTTIKKINTIGFPGEPKKAILNKNIQNAFFDNSLNSA